MRQCIAVDLRPLLEPHESGVTVYVREMVIELMKNKDLNLLLFYQSINRCNKIHEIFPKVWHVQKSNSIFHLISLFRFQKLPADYFPYTPDLIWLPDRRPFFKTDIPIVMTVHDFVPELHLSTMSIKGKLWHKIFSLKRLQQITSGLLFPSLSVASKFNNPNLKFDVTYEGANLSKEQIPPLNSKKIKTRPFFLCISPADPRKRINWIYLMAKRFSSVNFVIAGIKPNDLRFPKTKLKNQKNLILLNEVSEQEKTWLLRNAKALISVSKYEGFDLPVLEAVRARCPVIMSDIDVHRELYKYNSYVKNIDDLAFSIKKVLMGIKEIPVPRGHYTWELAAKRALLFFRRVIVDKNR